MTPAAPDDRLQADVTYLRERVDDLYALVAKKAVLDERRLTSLEQRAAGFALLISSCVSLIAWLLR